jgi:anti-sigma-K factor RskA
MNYERSELLEKLAGAYVLGTMAARARPRFARLLAESTQAQRAVAQWNNDLAPLAASVPPLQPPAAVWEAISAKTKPGAAKEAAAAAAATQHSWWHGLLNGWGRSAVAFGLGAVLAVGVVANNPHMMGMHHMDASLPASYVGILSDEKGEAVLTAGSHRRGETMKIKMLKPLAIPAGKVAKLWALPKDGAPVPVADVPASGSVMIELTAPAEDIFSKVSTLAVSFESDVGAKAPSLPFVLSGHCVKFW